MVGSAAKKQGRSANRKHTYFFFWPYINLGTANNYILADMNFKIRLATVITDGGLWM